MAADPKKAKGKEVEEGDEATDQAGDEGKKKKKKLIIMIGVAVLLMGISIGGTLLAVKLMSSDSKKDVAEETDDADEEENAEEDAEEETEEAVEAAPAIYFTMTPNFTVNFNVDGRQRYLQAEITLLYRNPEVDALLKLHMPAIRNQLVMLLGGKTFEELQNPESREKLKLESLAAIQSILDKENAALQQKDKEAEDEEKADEEEEESEEAEDESDSEKPMPLVIEQVLFTRFVMQ
jgi:flagellar protein FliL